ncbi:phage major capsid protein [Ruminococcus sp.]|uniref:phage major capsid protein n=1 Tax=Ruminococcus sp. TaxID=41978 RepID=UPI003FD7B4AD
MNKKEYLDKRNALYDKAKKLIAENKLAEAKEITQQIDKLDSDFENSAVNEANKNAEEGIKMPAPFKNHETNIDLTGESTESSDIFASVEYRKAFANFVTRGTEIPAKFKNAASTTTSSTAATIVPTTVYQKLIVELEKVGDIYARVFKSSYPTALLIPTQSIRPVASWVDEDKGSDEQKVSTDKISFSGYKLECKVAFSLLMTVTALDIFEAQFIDQIKSAMIKAIEESIISGTGSGAPTGILNETPADGQTINIAKATKLSYNTLLDAEGALPSAYDNAVWLMTKKSFYRFLGITDTNGQPVARINAGLNGKPASTLLGRTVVFTDGYMENYVDAPTADTTFAMLFDLNDYVLNEMLGLSIKKYTDEDTDNTKLKAVMLADGKVVDKHSLVKLIKKSA